MIMMFLEHKFFRDKDGKLYCEKVINDDFLNRYTDNFGQICICARTLSQNPRNSIYIKNDKISLLKLPNYNFNAMMKNYFRIAKIIKNKAKDCNGFIIRAPSTISFISFNVLRKLKKPIMTEIVIDPHHFFQDGADVSFLRKTINFYFRKYAILHTKSICKNSNAVLYVTNNTLQKDYKSFSNLHGEDKNHFSIGCSDVILKKDSFSTTICEHKKGEPFVICHVGWMMGLNKGHKTVMEVVSELRKIGLPCKIIFIGDGPMRTEFESYSKKLGIDDVTTFAGQVNDFNEMKSIFNKSHLFLFPSINEGLPRAILEAMANSLPCISYNTDGIPELIDQDYLANIDDIDRLCELVHHFFDDEELRKTVAKNNYIKALDYEDVILDKKRNEFYQKFNKLLISGDI